MLIFSLFRRFCFDHLSGPWKNPELVSQWQLCLIFCARQTEFRDFSSDQQTCPLWMIVWALRFLETRSHRCQFSNLLPSLTFSANVYPKLAAARHRNMIHTDRFRWLSLCCLLCLLIGPESASTLKFAFLAHQAISKSVQKFPHSFTWGIFHWWQHPFHQRNIQLDQCQFFAF